VFFNFLNASPLRGLEFKKHFVLPKLAFRQSKQFFGYKPEGGLSSKSTLKTKLSVSFLNNFLMGCPLGRVLSPNDINLITCYYNVLDPTNRGSTEIRKTGPGFFEGQRMPHLFGTNGSRNESTCKIAVRLCQFSISHSVRNPIVTIWRK